MLFNFTKNSFFDIRRSSHLCSFKKAFLKISPNQQESTCVGVFFNKLAETTAQWFSSEFCKIFNNTFFIKHLQTTAPIYVWGWKRQKNDQNIIWKVSSLVDTGHKLNVHKTCRRRPGRFLNVLCTFNLRPVSAGSW